MEIRIGVQNASREVVLESTEPAATVEKTVSDALAGTSALRLQDEKGRTVMVPVAAIAYVEIGAEEARRVGFGAV